MTVVDAAGDEVGELIDVVANLLTDPPLVNGFFVQSGEDEQLFVRWDQVQAVDVDEERLELRVPRVRLAPSSLRPDEIALVDAVLDNQVLDMRNRKFVRVQDVTLEPRGGDLAVTGVDASSGAVMRRIGLGFLSRRMSRREGDFVPWQDVNLISLRLSRLNFVEAFAELAELHPADLADIISQVGPRERATVLGALNAQLAADTLQELEPELRNAAILEMSVERALAVLSEVDPDEAADLLTELPADVSEALLGGLPASEAAAIRGLASHPEHSAGALMTTDFVSLRQDVTAAAAVVYIRTERPEDEALSVIFLTDEQGALVGSLSLRDLVLADPAQPLREVMDDEVVRVAADADEEEVGRLMTRYDLLALPVVDECDHILGIVTLDDALEAILPEEWKHRLPRLFR
jgi:magnesium transporter